MSEEMGMLFAFPDGSESFVNGFEAGMIWQQIDGDGMLSIDRGFAEGFPVHTANIALIGRMANARGYTLETGHDVDGWTPVRLTYVGTGRAKPALSIVKEQ